MSQTLTIARRELASLFFSPIGYVVIGLFALTTTMLFFLFFESGQPATMRDVLFYVIWIMIFLVPAISMRLISEEFRGGTIEMLMTAPISDTQVVLGKWLGAMSFYLVLLLAPLGVLIGILAAHGNPDFGPIITQMLGLVLVGALYLSIGTAASAATQSQIIAFLLTMFMTGLLTLGMAFLSRADFVQPYPWLRATLFHLYLNTQFEEFNKGVIDTSCLVYFITSSALFLFIAVKLLESRRWR